MTPNKYFKRPGLLHDGGSQTTKNSGKAPNLTLAKATQIQKRSCCKNIIRSKQMKKKLQQ